MGKKKRNHPDVEEILARPWCYYCERDFDDLKILINHQKAKHFKCERCGRRLNTAGGLSVHMSQVHKENLTAVDNALPNRAGLDIEIFGMEGIPEEIIQQHNQRVLTQFHQAEAERRAASGQGPAGGIGANPAKKPKTDISDLKKRLAEHKAAKLAAENGDGSRTTTPDGTSQTQSPAPSASFQAPAPNYQQYQQQPQPYAPPPSAASYGQAVSYSQPPTPTGYQAPGYPQAASPVYGQPPAGIPYQQPPYAQPPQPPFQQQPPLHPLPNAFSPPPFQTPSPYPGQPFSPTLPQNGRSGQPVGIPHPFNSGSPAQNQQQQQQRTNSPGQNGLPVRPGSGALPAAPGLPQRPTFGAPPVNAFQFQQMHQGQIPAPQFSPPAYSGPPGVQNGGHSAQPPPGLKQDQPSTAAIDDLISSASKQADANTAVAASKPAETQPTETSTPTVPTTTEPTKSQSTEEKAAKKEKEKAKQTRLVYSDNEISPEEKMAAFPKYAFTSQQQTVTV